MTMQYRTGIGYDIHRLVKGRKLVLGGIAIPFSKGLDGHSDADVLLHAIGDALLGALGLGDIGEHFPNTDKAYKDISSRILLSRVYRLVKKRGFGITNVDTVVIAEKPALKLWKPKMRATIAHTLAIAQNRINIKATTPEGLGLGRGKDEAIAAYATVLLTKREQR